MFLMLDPGQYGGQQSMSGFLLEEKHNHLDMKTKVKNFLKVFKGKAGVILSSYFQQIPKLIYPSMYLFSHRLIKYLGRRTSLSSKNYCIYIYII